MCRVPKQKSPSPLIEESCNRIVERSAGPPSKCKKLRGGVKLASLKEYIAVEKSHSIEACSKRELLLPSFEVSECD